jgi:hypothetical protein
MTSLFIEHTSFMLAVTLIKEFTMNVEKLEEALKAHCKDNFLDMDLSLNDHKTCYCTIAEHERTYKNITYDWITKEERQAAYAADEMWGLSVSGAGDNTYKGNTSNKLAALLMHWGQY